MASLAIIIPYYKLSLFEATLTTLANQTNTNFNVYIGDDASPEDPTTMISSFSDRLNMTYVRFDTNLGGTSLVKQWERCIALKQDEPWMTILGDDDYYSPNVVARFYEELEVFEAKSHVVRFATQTKFVEDKTITIPYTHPIWETAVDSYYRKFKGKTRSSLSEYFFKSSVYLKHGFTAYPLAWYSDDKAWLDFTEGLPIYTINDAAIIISVSKISLTGMKNNRLDKLKAQQLFLKSLIINPNYNLDKVKRFDFVRAFEAVSKTLGIFTFKEQRLVMHQFFMYFGWLSLLKFIKRQWFF